MTFVKTRLLIEKMSPGDTAEILLRGEEPIQNVPQSVTELGHTIIARDRVAQDGPGEPGAAGQPDDVRLRIRKNRNRGG